MTDTVAFPISSVPRYAPTLGFLMTDTVAFPVCTYARVFDD